MLELWEIEIGVRGFRGTGVNGLEKISRSVEETIRRVVVHLCNARDISIVHLRQQGSKLVKVIGIRDPIGIDMGSHIF